VRFVRCESPSISRSQPQARPELPPESEAIGQVGRNSSRAIAPLHDGSGGPTGNARRASVMGETFGLSRSIDIEIVNPTPIVFSGDGTMRPHLWRLRTAASRAIKLRARNDQADLG
jgi:hypothetical protein